MVVQLSWSRHIKGPRTGRFKTTLTDFLAVLEVTSPKSRCPWDCTPSEVSGGGGGFFLALLSLGGRQQVLANPWPADASLQSLPLSSRGLLLCVSVSNSLLIRTPAIGLGPKLIQYDLIVTNYICKDPISELGHMHKVHVDMNFGDATQASSGGLVLQDLRSRTFFSFLESFRKSLRNVSFSALGHREKLNVPLGSVKDTLSKGQPGKAPRDRAQWLAWPRAAGPRATSLREGACVWSLPGKAESPTDIASFSCRDVPAFLW